MSDHVGKRLLGIAEKYDHIHGPQLMLLISKYTLNIDGAAYSEYDKTIVKSWNQVLDMQHKNGQFSNVDLSPSLWTTRVQIGFYTVV